MAFCTGLVWGLHIVQQDSAVSEKLPGPEVRAKQQESGGSRVSPGSGGHEQHDGQDDEADQDDEQLDKKMRDKAWVCEECSQVAG